MADHVAGDPYPGAHHRPGAHLRGSNVPGEQPYPAPQPPPDLTVSELAYLAGGPRRVMLTSLSALVERGVVDADLRPLREPTGADGLDEVQYAAFHSLVSRGGADFTALRTDCGPAVARIRDHLRELGLAPPPDITSKTWFRVFIGVAIALFFASFLFPPIAIVSFPVWFAMIGTLVASRLRNLPVHKTARGVMGDARARHSVLDPAYRPAYAAYGGNALSTGVALFGIGALATALPALAAAPAVAALGVHGTEAGSSAFMGSSSSVGTTTACTSSCSGASGGSDGSSCGSSCGGGGCGGCGGGGD